MRGFIQPAKEKAIIIVAKKDASRSTKVTIAMEGMTIGENKEKVFTLISRNDPENKGRWLLRSGWPLSDGRQVGFGWEGWLPKSEFIHIATKIGELYTNGKRIA